MAKKNKSPWEQIFSVSCPDPQCCEMIEIPGCFQGEGLCNCHRLKIQVTWHDAWTPELKMTQLISKLH